jgi:hypothetical protein
MVDGAGQPDEVAGLVEICASWLAQAGAGRAWLSGLELAEWGRPHAAGSLGGLGHCGHAKLQGLEEGERGAGETWMVHLEASEPRAAVSVCAQVQSAAPCHWYATAELK